MTVLSLDSDKINVLKNGVLTKSKSEFTLWVKLNLSLLPDSWSKSKYYFSGDVKRRFYGSCYIRYLLENSLISEPCCVCNKPLSWNHRAESISSNCGDVKCIAYRTNFKSKRKETYLKNYGVDHPFKNKAFRDKISNTMIERYGKPHAFEVKEFMDKANNTILERYGVSHVAHSSAITKKKKETCLKRYGVSNPGQHKPFRDKQEATSIKRYGVKTFTQSKEYKDSRSLQILEPLKLIFKQENVEILEVYTSSKINHNTPEVLQVFPQVQAYARSQKVPCLAVFAAEDEETVKKKIMSTRFGTTMFQPATLRDIRMHFEDIGAVTR